MDYTSRSVHSQTISESDENNRNKRITFVCATSQQYVTSQFFFFFFFFFFFSCAYQFRSLNVWSIIYTHSVPTICTQTGTCDTQSGDLVFFSTAFDEFSLFTKN